jgi:hypothetical protein
MIAASLRLVLSLSSSVFADNNSEWASQPEIGSDADQCACRRASGAKSAQEESLTSVSASSEASGSTRLVQNIHVCVAATTFAVVVNICKSDIARAVRPTQSFHTTFGVATVKGRFGGAYLSTDEDCIRTAKWIHQIDHTAPAQIREAFLLPASA